MKDFDPRSRLSDRLWRGGDGEHNAFWQDLHQRVRAIKRHEKDAALALTLLSHLIVEYNRVRGEEPPTADPASLENTPKGRADLVQAWQNLQDACRWSAPYVATVRTHLTHALDLVQPGMALAINPLTRRRRRHADAPDAEREDKKMGRSAPFNVHECLPVRVRVLSEDHDDRKLFDAILHSLSSRSAPGNFPLSRLATLKRMTWLDGLLFHVQSSFFPAELATDAESRLAYLRGRTATEWVQRLSVVTEDASISLGLFERHVRTINMVRAALDVENRVDIPRPCSRRLHDGDDVMQPSIHDEAYRLAVRVVTDWTATEEAPKKKRQKPQAFTETEIEQLRELLRKK